MVEIGKVKVKRLSRREFLISFIVTLLTVVVESIVLILNINMINVSSLSDFLSSPLKICIYVAYILSVFLIPMIAVFLADFVHNIRRIYKFYVIKSLKLESVRLMDKLSTVLLILVPTSFLLIIVSIVLRIYMLSLYALIPLGLYVILLVKPIYNVYNHSKGIDVELPWFLILLIVIESINTNIKLLIEKLRYTNILPAITRELLVVDRDSKLYSQSYISAFIYRAGTTPNTNFSNILSGYASRLRSGGEVIPWLRSKLNELLMVNEFMIRLYSERIASVFGQLMLALYIIIPLITAAVYTINVYIPIVLMVLATPILILLTYISRPKTLNSIPVTNLIIAPIASLISLSIILYKFVGPHSIAIGWATALGITFMSREMLREQDILERDSIEIIKMMVELRQSGLDVVKALEYILTSNMVNMITAKKLKMVITMLYQGVPLTYTAIKIPSHSFLFKFTLFTLGLVYECGGGDPEVFQTLYEYITKIRTLHVNIEKTSRFFDIFAFINIFILVWIWRSLTPLYESFAMFNPISNVMLNQETFYMIAYISLLGYSLVSSTIRNGIPVLELRSSIFLLTILMITFLVIV